MGSSVAAPVTQATADQQMSVAVVVNTITTIINTDISICVSGIAAEQAIKIRCNPAPELVLAFQTSLACTDCQAQYNSELAKNTNCPVCYACVATDLVQTLVLTYDPNVCAPFGPDTIQISKQVSIDIRKQITQNPAFLKKNSGWIPRGVNQATFFNQVENMVSSEDITQILLTMRYTQSISFDSTGGSVQSGVVQRILTYQISDLVSKKLASIGITSAFNVANTPVSQQSTNADKQQTAQMYTLYFTLAFVVILLIVIACYALMPRRVVTPAIDVVLPVTATGTRGRQRPHPPQAVVYSNGK